MSESLGGRIWLTIVCWVRPRCRMAVDRGNLSGRRCDGIASGNIGQGDLRWRWKTLLLGGVMCGK